MDPIDLNKFMKDFKACDHWLYQWGAKPDYNASPASIDESDCSGFGSWILHRRGWNGFGRSSMELRDWFDTQGFHKPDFANLFKPAPSGARDDGGRLFAFQWDHGGTHRHWGFVCAGATMECASGLHGVGSRDGSRFIGVVQNCWEIPVKL